MGIQMTNAIGSESTLKIGHTSGRTFLLSPMIPTSVAARRHAIAPACRKTAATKLTVCIGEAGTAKPPMVHPMSATVFSRTPQMRRTKPLLRSRVGLSVICGAVMIAAYRCTQARQPGPDYSPQVSEELNLVADDRALIVSGREMLPSTIAKHERR